MKKYRPIGIIILWVVVLCLFGWQLVSNAKFDVLSPSGDIARQQRDLLLFTLGLSLVVVVPVFTMLGLFAWRYREGAKADYAPDFSSSKKLEILWWGIPLLIIGILSVVTWQTSHSLDPYRSINSDQDTLEVQVVALQWKWLFIYPELKVATVNELRISRDRPVHFTLSADAPMSSFWIPSLGSQIYSMAGMSSQLNLIANKTGVFKGYNTNINGEGYAKMNFSVHVVEPTEFETWAKEVAGSSHVLDDTHVAELVKPSTISDPMYMRLLDASVYDQIVGRFMMNHSSANDSNASTMDTMHDAMTHGGAQ